MKTNNLDIRNMDCMDLMREYPDNHFDLAVVDPPYGIGVANDDRFGKKASSKAATETANYKKKDWDNSTPGTEYWDELFRVSKDQIVWGVNYFDDSRLIGGRIFWDKVVPENYTKSKGELAFKSKGIGVDKIEYAWHGMIQHDMKNKETRIHPTQKPVGLYKRILHKYAKEESKILDTHLGGGSIAIACHYANHHLTACEIDSDYYIDACKRISSETRQLDFFNNQQMI